MSSFLKNIEMVLNVMSLPVLWLIHHFVSSRFSDPWKLTAFAAIVVALLHGTLGWLVRTRQRAIRDQILGRLYGTLADIKDPNDIHELDHRIKVALAQLPALRREPLGYVAVPEPRYVGAGGEV